MRIKNREVRIENGIHKKEKLGAQYKCDSSGKVTKQANSWKGPMPNLEQKVIRAQLQIWGASVLPTFGYPRSPFFVYITVTIHQKHKDGRSTTFEQSMLLVIYGRLKSSVQIDQGWCRESKVGPPIQWPLKTNLAGS